MHDGMYHSSDPNVESFTHEIRKQFYDTILEIEHQGKSIDSIEAFLINDRDMDKIHKLFSGTHNIAGGPSDGQMKMYGVKIIESQYIPEGTIFKVFKNEEQMPYPASGSISSYRPDGSLIGTSGVMPNWNQPMPPGVGVPQTPDYAYQYEQDEKEDVKETEPVEKRHSTRRRIELDE